MAKLVRGKLCGIQACGKQVLFDQPMDRRDADAVAVARAKERPVVRQHDLTALDQVPINRFTAA